VQKGLKDLGIFDSKKTGIPDWYMNADKDTRLAVTAGFAPDRPEQSEPRGAVASNFGTA
jgi:hypothetical protein